MLANAHTPMARFDIAAFKEPLLAGELSSASDVVLLPPVEDDGEELVELVVEVLFDEASAMDELPLVVGVEEFIAFATKSAKVFSGVALMLNSIPASQCDLLTV